MDLQSLLTNDVTVSDIEKQALMKYAKEHFPHLVYDSIPIEWNDDNISIKNADVASELQKWQREVLYNWNPCEHPYLIAFLRNRQGKASSHSSKVWTPDGFKLMGDIKKGDYVLTPDGGKAKVLEKYPQGKVDIYKVTFSDGSSTEVTKDHLWKTTCRKLPDKYELLNQYKRL
jgi:hypothetical protein